MNADNGELPYASRYELVEARATTGRSRAASSRCSKAGCARGPSCTHPAASITSRRRVRRSRACSDVYPVRGSPDCRPPTSRTRALSRSMVSTSVPRCGGPLAPAAAQQERERGQATDRGVTPAFELHWNGSCSAGDLANAFQPSCGAAITVWPYKLITGSPGTTARCRCRTPATVPCPHCRLVVRWRHAWPSWPVRPKSASAGSCHRPQARHVWPRLACSTCPMTRTRSTISAQCQSTRIQ